MVVYLRIIKWKLERIVLCIKLFESKSCLSSNQKCVIYAELQEKNVLKGILSNEGRIITAIISL